MAGQMVHVEIPAGNTAKAMEFWGGLFGWQFQEYPGSPTEYHMTRFSDAQGGAIYGKDDGTRGTRVSGTQDHERFRCVGSPGVPELSRARHSGMTRVPLRARRSGTWWCRGRAGCLWHR